MPDAAIDSPQSRICGRPTHHRVIFEDDRIGVTYGLIGSVELVDCVCDYDSPWALPNCWHWVLANPVQFKRPIPMRGRLSLFNVELQRGHRIKTLLPTFKPWSLRKGTFLMKQPKNFGDDTELLDPTKVMIPSFGILIWWMS